jgi:uncharacterized protein YkwD
LVALRWQKGGALALGLLAASATSAQATLEARILSTLNAVRADPGGFALALDGSRPLYHARLMVLPGRPERLLTQEGVSAVNEAIGFLDRQPRLGPVANGPLLARAAADHVAEQRVNGAIGHYDRDGEGPGDRVRRHGGGEQVAEVITYGATDAADVVRQLVVDDGVPERDHRAILFDPRLHYAGVSCGTHPTYRTMCVIDMAMTSDGTEDDVPLRTPALRSGR